MKRNYLIIMVLASVIVAFHTVGYAATASSASYQLVETVASTKGYAESANYKAYTSTGQPAPTTVTSSANYIQQGGFIRHLDSGQWVLNLIEVPWYPNELAYYKGAAVSQMILNYIRDGAGQPWVTQAEIYAFGHPALDNAEMTPTEMDTVLGHFDPYDLLVSNNYDTYDSLLGGNPYQGYNFSIDSHNSSDITNYLKNICHWMAYKVRQEAWWMKGAFVARPHTPAALPFYGIYYWVTVKGFAADQNPTPDPSNPFLMPNFTVYGFWFKDPQLTGIGMDTYTTATESVATYLLPLATPDTYNGKLVQIAEPPAAESSAEISIGTPVSKSAVLAQISSRSSNGTAQMTALTGNNIIRCETLVDSFAASDPEFRRAVENTGLHEIITVRKVTGVAGTETGENYDLLTFGKETESGYKIFAVVRLSSGKAVFQEVSWASSGQAYPKVTKEQALQIALPYLAGYDPAALTVDAVWWRTEYSLSPFQLIWRISYYESPLIYVTQQGTIIRKPRKVMSPTIAVY